MNKYQEQAARTLIDGPDFDLLSTELMIIWNAVGLAGETGEILDHIEKGIFHGHGIDKDHLKEELGDVMWYIAGLCTKLGLDLDEVLAFNIKKLEKRYPNGYSSEDSKNRVE